jgi:hypothetical protein
MVQIVGHDILKDWYSYPELHQVWINLGESGQAREFRAWLSSQENCDSMIILDDLDGLRDDQIILECLPDGDILNETPHHYHIYPFAMPPIPMPSMDRAGIRKLLEVLWKRHGLRATSEEIEEVLSIVDGHPLVASRVVPYMKQLALEVSSAVGASSVQAFIDIFKSQNWKARNKFLKYKIHFGPSIEEIFEVSVESLDAERKDATLQFLGALGIICGTEPLVDYYNFLSVQGSWLAGLQTQISALFVSGMEGKVDSPRTRKSLTRIQTRPRSPIATIPSDLARMHTPALWPLP